MPHPDELAAPAAGVPPRQCSPRGRAHFGQAGINLLVVRFGINQEREIALAKQRFEQNGVKIKGAVFNAVQKRASGYYS